MNESKTVETLDKVEPGSKCVIKKIGLRGVVRRRLLDMGLIAGSEVEVVRVAPLGDPMELKLKGYLLSVRKESAEHITVKVIISE